MGGVWKKATLVLCEYNRAPQLALFFPEVDDPRALTFHRLAGRLYESLVRRCAEAAEAELRALKSKLEGGS